MHPIKQEGVVEDLQPFIGHITSSRAGEAPTMEKGVAAKRPLSVGDVDLVRDSSPTEAEQVGNRVAGAATEAVAAQAKKIKTAQAHATYAEEKSSSTPLSHETIWKALRIKKLKFKSPAWNPIKYPRPGRGIDNDPPGPTLRYDTPQSFHCPVEKFEEDVRNTVNNDIVEGLPDLPYKPSFSYRKDGITVPCRPEARAFKNSHRTSVEILFSRYQQCAFFAQIKSFLVKCSSCHSMHLLTLRKAGQCHDPSLLAIELTPAAQFIVGNPNDIDTELYINALTWLLESNSALDLIGAWQHTTKWNDGHEQSRPMVLMVVKRTPNFKVTHLDGYGNDHGLNHIPSTMNASDVTWFRFRFDGRLTKCGIECSRSHSPHACYV